jgi:hypothetical protein
MDILFAESAKRTDFPLQLIPKALWVAEKVSCPMAQKKKAVADRLMALPLMLTSSISG